MGCSKFPHFIHCKAIDELRMKIPRKRLRLKIGSKRVLYLPAYSVNTWRDIV